MIANRFGQSRYPTRQKSTDTCPGEVLTSAKGLQSPVFVWEPRDLTAFDSLEEACKYVEHEDVDASTGYDARGQKFRFGLAMKPVSAFGFTLWHRRAVRAIFAEDDATHEAELRSILADSLGQQPDAPLETLVREAVRRF